MTSAGTGLSTRTACRAVVVGLLTITLTSVAITAVLSLQRPLG